MKEKDIQAKVKQVVLKLVGWLETIISIILLVVTVLLTIGMVRYLISGGTVLFFEEENARSLVERFFELVICIEFVRMLSKHSVESVIEIILFSIAREMIAEVQSPVETLILIAALCGLMVIRKYFFIPEDKEKLKE